MHLFKSHITVDELSHIPKQKQKNGFGSEGNANAMAPFDIQNGNLEKAHRKLFEFEKNVA